MFSVPSGWQTGTGLLISDHQVAILSARNHLLRHGSESRDLGFMHSWSYASVSRRLQGHLNFRPLGALTTRRGRDSRDQDDQRNKCKTHCHGWDSMLSCRWQLTTTTREVSGNEYDLGVAVGERRLPLRQRCGIVSFHPAIGRIRTGDFGRSDFPSIASIRLTLWLIIAFLTNCFTSVESHQTAVCRFPGIAE